ncbi:MAG: diguanylate cyclase [Chloroflexota bacterium]
MAEGRQDVRGLSPVAKLYIAVAMVLGVELLVLSWPALPATPDQQLAFAVLVAAAAIAHLFPVITSNNQAYYVTPVFIFAGLLLLPPSALGLLIVLAFVPSWLRSKYPWHIQLFNLANLLIDAFLARALFVRLGGSSGGPLVEPHILLAALLAVTVFTFLNHLLLGVVFRLTRGDSWRDTRLFDAENLLVDGTLTCTGIIVALLWQVSPWLVGLTITPLFLTYRALTASIFHEQAISDPKTGLYNSRHFANVLEGEFRRAVRYRRPLSVIMADLDLLRNVNNTYGHLAGDAVLRGVARIITEGLRESDVACRFGGEEFAVVLLETDSAEAFAVAQRLRKRVESTDFRASTSSEPIRATLSLGVASFPNHGEDASSIVHQADLAVYYAKLRGRNRVWVASPESTALRPLVNERTGTAQAGSADGHATDGAWPSLAGAEASAALAQADVTSARGREAPKGQNGAGRIGADGADLMGMNLTSELAAERVERANRSVRLRSFLLAVTLADAVAVWAVFRPWEARLDWPNLGALCLVMLIAQVLPLDTYGRGKVYTGSVFLLAGGILFGLPVAVVLAPALAIATWVSQRGSVYKLTYDIGATTLWATGAMLAYEAVVALLAGLEPVFLLLPAALAGVTYYLADAGLQSLALGLKENRPSLDVWEEHFRGRFLHYIIFGALAQLLAFTYGSAGIYGLVSFVVPLLMLHYVTKRAAEKATQSIADLKQAAADLIRTQDKVDGELQSLQATYDATILQFSSAMDRRDCEAPGHSQRVTSYAALIAKELGLGEDDARALRNGAMLHDVGKIGIPETVLNKPGPLSLGEWTAMRAHPEEGCRMLQHIGFLASALPVIRCHHERYDGKGYPLGVKGEAIPLVARVFSVADAFDAMTTPRPYRPAYSTEAAREEVIRCAGSQFDPRVVEAFLLVDAHELEQIRVRTMAEAGARVKEGREQQVSEETLRRMIAAMS